MLTKFLAQNKKNEKNDIAARDQFSKKEIEALMELKVNKEEFEQQIQLLLKGAKRKNKLTAIQGGVPELDQDLACSAQIPLPNAPVPGGGGPALLSQSMEGGAYNNPLSMKNSASMPGLNAESRFGGGMKQMQQKQFQQQNQSKNIQTISPQQQQFMQQQMLQQMMQQQMYQQQDDMNNGQISNGSTQYQSNNEDLDSRSGSAGLGIQGTTSGSISSVKVNDGDHGGHGDGIPQFQVGAQNQVWTIFLNICFYWISDFAENIAAFSF